MKDHREFFQYVIPSMLAFALSGIYAIADGFFVGNAMGDSALAAINVAYPLTAFLQATGTGIGMGGAVEYSIAMGSQKPRRSREFFSMALFLLLGLGALFTFLFMAIGAPMLRLFGATGEIYTLGREYIFFISLGAVFQILGTGLVPFIRNMGGSVTAMVAMITGFLTNIILDYLMVWRFPMGMTGAAVATDVGQGVTFLVCLCFFLRKKEKPVFSFGKYAFPLIKKIFQVGISPFGLTFAPNITLILVNKSASVFGGAMAVTCYAPVSYICCVVQLLLQGVSDGCQPLLSLSYGQGKEEKTLQLRNLAYRFSFLVSLVCVALLFLLRDQAGALFGASQSVTIEISRILPVFLAGYIFVSISRVTTSYFYATGKALRAYVLIYGEPVLLALLLLFVPVLAGIWGTWASVPLSQLSAMILGIFFIRIKS